jgi:uncharacterized membrane protein
VARVDNAIDINAPADKVFGYVSEVGRQPEWVKWAKTVEVTSADRVGVGATDQMKMQVGPQRSKVEGIVTEYRDGQMVGRRLTKGMDWFERISVVPVGNGTKVAYSVEYKPPMGPFGQMMDFLFMVRLVDQLMKDSLTNLKTNLEQAT